MKPGICVIHTREKDINKAFEKVRNGGFDNCQLVCWDFAVYTDAEADTIKKAMAAYGVTITALWAGWRAPKVWDFYDGQETLGIVPQAYRAGRMDDICNGSDFAKKLGVTDVITHAGFLPENPHDANYPAVIASLRAIARHMEHNGQRFLLETGQETPVTLLRAIQDVGTGNIYVNLDPANLIMYGKGNPVDALDVIGSYVCGVHAKDGLYPTNGRELGMEVPLGEGKANFPALIEKLYQLGYNGSLTIEREIEGEQQEKDIQMAKIKLEGYINGR